MDLLSYKKKILPRAALCALFNAGFLILYPYVESLGYGRIHVALLCLYVIGNFIFLFLNIGLVIDRFNSLLNQKNKFKGFLWYLAIYYLPLFGVYVLYKNFQDIHPGTLSLKRIIKYRLLPIFLLTIVLTGLLPKLREREPLIANIGYLISAPLVNYSFDSGERLQKTLSLKENIKNICPDENKRPNCVFERIKKKNASAPIGISEAVLYVAIDAMELFKYKTREPRSVEKNALVAKTLIQHNLEILNMTCNRTRPIDYNPSLIHFFLGNAEQALLEIVDEMIRIKLYSVAISSLSEVALNVSKKFNVQQELSMISKFKNSSCFKSTVLN
nr:hypothetical protein BHI3_27460 [Bacteriovorax sp. HI3]